ncbi:hypothetical protein UlMin_004471 [Ulmus minor]
MVRQVSKGMRVFSHQTNKLLHLVFARNYVKYLLQALKKINVEKRITSTLPDDRNSKEKFAKIVRFEVDMALVLSAKNFAWSRALEAKLQRNVVGLQVSSRLNHPFSFSCIVESRPKISRNPTYNPFKIIKKSSFESRSRKGQAKKGKEERFNSRLAHLRRLLPGGCEMEDTKLLTELRSYIICLKLQVKLLHCLVETH